MQNEGSEGSDSIICQAQLRFEVTYNSEPKLLFRVPEPLSRTHHWSQIPSLTGLLWRGLLVSLLADFGRLWRCLLLLLLPLAHVPVLVLLRLAPTAAVGLQPPPVPAVLVPRLFLAIALMNVMNEADNYLHTGQ